MFRHAAVILLAAVSVYAMASAGIQARSIPGVDVIVKPQPGNATVARSTTDPNGKFTLSGLAAGSYTLTFTILAAQQVPEQTMGKTYSDSKSNTAARSRVGAEELFAFQGWPYEILLAAPGVTFGEAKISKVRSAIVIEIAFTVTGNGTVSISGTAQSNEVAVPPSGVPSNH